MLLVCLAQPLVLGMAGVFSPPSTTTHPPCTCSKLLRRRGTRATRCCPLLICNGRVIPRCVFEGGTTGRTHEHTLFANPPPLPPPTTQVIELNGTVTCVNNPNGTYPTCSGAVVGGDWSRFCPCAGGASEPLWSQFGVQTKAVSWDGFTTGDTTRWTGAFGPTSGGVQWVSPTAGSESSPVVGWDGTIFVGSSTGKLSAVNVSTGATQWAFKTGAAISSTPAISANGNIYVTSMDYSVYCLYSDTGKQVWRFKTGSWVQASPGIGPDGHTVYVGSADKNFYALDGMTGALQWKFVTTGTISAAPAFVNNGVNNLVVFGSWDNKVYALDVALGTLQWTYTTGGAVKNAPAIGPDGTVFIGSSDSLLYALESVFGGLKWTFSAANEILTSAAVLPGGSMSDYTIFISSSKNIYSLNGATGAVNWFASQFGAVSSPAVDGAGNVYVGGASGWLYALNGYTGHQLFGFKTNGAIASLPAISPGDNLGVIGPTVYVSSFDGNLYALSASSATATPQPTPLRTTSPAPSITARPVRCPQGYKRNNLSCFSLQGTTLLNWAQSNKVGSCTHKGRLASFTTVTDAAYVVGQFCGGKDIAAQNTMFVGLHDVSTTGSIRKWAWASAPGAKGVSYLSSSQRSVVNQQWGVYPSSELQYSSNKCAVVGALGKGAGVGRWATFECRLGLGVASCGVSSYKHVPRGSDGASPPFPPPSQQQGWRPVPQGGAVQQQVGTPAVLPGCSHARVPMRRHQQQAQPTARNGAARSIEWEDKSSGIALLNLNTKTLTQGDK